MTKLGKNNRWISIVVCAFFLAYLLTFVFEGKVFYSLIYYYETNEQFYFFLPIISHFIGLFSCGFFVKSSKKAKAVLCIGMLTCVIATIPFFFSPSIWWNIGLIITGFAGGCAFSSWGYFLKSCSRSEDRMRTCADILILSNIIMILIDITTVYGSAVFGLVLSIVCIIMAVILAGLLPVEEIQLGNDESEVHPKEKKKSVSNVKKPLLTLIAFVVVITINSGLMYRVINPAFMHLSFLESWYWAVPYIVVLLIMRLTRKKVKRSIILYVGIAMIMGAFICFMLMGRGEADYIVIDTLMLGACGIFDLFWWSMVGEMLEYTDRPGIVSGMGLAANVFGILIGEVIGVVLSAYTSLEEYVTVIALCVICITIAIIPILEKHLSALLKSNTEITEYLRMDQKQQNQIIQKNTNLSTLTGRENDVLKYILAGKSNKEISTLLSITENTVKTHARNIYSKYEVNNRIELISSLLNHENE